jgi:hypothetical protein
LPGADNLEIGIDEQVVTREEFPMENTREFLKNETIAIK